MCAPADRANGRPASMSDFSLSVSFVGPARKSENPAPFAGMRSVDRAAISHASAPPHDPRRHGSGAALPRADGWPDLAWRVVCRCCCHVWGRLADISTQHRLEQRGPGRWILKSLKTWRGRFWKLLTPG